MKILVNYPTRGRLNKFINNIGMWIANASANHEITYLVKIDAEDKIMNNDHAKNLITEYLTKDHPNQKVVLRVLDTNTKIQAINACIGEYDFDVVVCAADDITPKVNDWDLEIAKDTNLDIEVCLNYNIDDRVKNFRDLVIMPVFTKKLYNRFKYIYHPTYRSEFCDNEQTEVLASLGLLNHIDKRPFYHDWYGNQDALMQRNMQIGQMHDKKNYEARKLAGFTI
jgi:hypothetical protein